MNTALASFWALDPQIDFLNHGSFGATPWPVLAAQAAWRERMEREPVRFLGRELEALLDDVRSTLGAFVGADPDDLALVANATAGVNTVLRSLRFAPGDELLVLDHAYNATLNAIRFAAARDGARVVLARVPFPSAGDGEVVEAVIGAATPGTRLAVIDHVTSPTALVLPVARLVQEFRERGIDVLVDGAHAPGMLDLDVAGLGGAYYAGTCHKWLCAPKGSGFLFVRRDRQTAIRPLAISHGANDPRADRSRYRLEFDWTGTFDPTPWLSIPDAIVAMASLEPGGWPALRAANRQLALEARERLAARLEVELPAPASMIGAMASVLLPMAGLPAVDASARADALARRLLEACGIEVPIIAWPPPWLVRSGDLPPSAPIGALVRLSAQRYNRVEQYERLADALVEVITA